MEDFEDKEKLRADITRLCSARLGIESDKITERKVALLFVHPVTTVITTVTNMVEVIS